MSKELLKDTLLGMRLSKKESEVIKGGVAASTASVGMSSVGMSTPTISFQVEEAAKFCFLTICNNSCFVTICQRYGTN